ncbi:MAG: zinc ribbon domain-containing protein [Bacilli bacterium]
MVDLKLENDEGIIQQSKNVERYQANDKYTEIYEMYLTNKNLIYIYEKSNGIFAKTEDVAEKIALDDIRVVNNKVQIFKIDDDDYGLGLQIIFKNGSHEHFIFEQKKEIQTWYNSIIETITGVNVTNEENIDKNLKNNKINKTIGNSTTSSVIISGLRSAMNSAKSAVNDIKNQVVEEFNKEENNKKQNIEEHQDEKVIIEKDETKFEEVKKNTEKEDKYMYCSKCGEKINNNSKFCNYCGEVVNPTTNEEKIEDKEIKDYKKDEEYTERKTVYDGKIVKCPNCGETLKSFTANCPTCGFELRGSKSFSAVTEFAEKLEEIESKREKKIKASKILSVFNIGQPLTTTDEQKISLIRSSPIPNTKEDLYEFLILSKSNVEIDLYENTQIKSARLAVSDAWKAKFEQAYHKAKLLFKNDDRMIEIQVMFDETNKAITNARWKNWKIVGICYGVIFVMIIIFILCGIIFNDNNTNNKSNKVADEARETNSIVTESNKDASSSNALNESKVLKQLKTMKYKFIEYGKPHTVFVIKNESEYTLNISVNFKFYGKNGNLIGEKVRSSNAVENNAETIMYMINDEDYEKMEFEISIVEDDYSYPIVKQLKYNSSKGSQKEILTVTNESDYVGQAVVAYAVFFKNKKIIGCDHEYMSDNSGELKSKKSLTKEFDCDKDYDDVKFYFTGFGE